MLLLKGPQQSARSVAFSPDGRLLATTSDRAKAVTVWDAVTGQPLEPLQSVPILHEAFTCLAFDPVSGRLIAANRRGQFSKWTPAAGTLHDVWSPPQPIYPTSLTFSPGGKELAVGGCQQRAYAVQLWGMRTGVLAASPVGAPRILSGREQVAYCVAFSPDGRFLVAGTEEGATVWDVEAGRVVNGLRHPSAVRAAAYSDDGRTLALAESRGASLWDRDTGEVRSAVEGQDGLVTCVAFGPGGGVLATGSWGGVVRLWAVSAGREMAAYDWDIGRVNAVAFSPDGMRAAAGGEAGIVIWDVDDLLA
jgi:WD40 repeat protein